LEEKDRHMEFSEEFSRGIDHGVKAILELIEQGDVLVDIQPRCKYCGSGAVVRFGTYGGRQRWWCKLCQRKFTDSTALYGMRTPYEQVASALNMYYEGMSLNAIRRHLKQMYGNYPSDSTVYDWLTRFTRTAVRQTADHQPDVGDVWVADETVLKIGGRKVWFWDLIDARTRYLLASHLSTSRTQYDARLLMARAAKCAGKPPKKVITDKLAAYIEGVGWNFGGQTQHVAAKSLTSSPGTQLIERFHSTLKSRTKVMRGLKKVETARLLLQGWLVHYNYFRPHESLGNRTPAQQAGVKYHIRNWKHVVKPPDTRVRRKVPAGISPRSPRVTPKRPPITQSRKGRLV